MSKVEISIDTKNGSSVKIDGKEMSGLITEIHLDIKPLHVPVMTVKISAQNLTFLGECSVVEQSRDI